MIQITNGLTLSSLALQTFVSEVTSPSQLTTGLAILLIGIFGVLTVATVKLNSPVALLAEAASGTFFMFSLIGITPIRLFYLVATIHVLALTASGVYYTNE